VSHANARLTVHARLELVRRVVQDGRPVAHVAAELNCSRATGYKWLRRWREQGPAGLVDRPSIAHRLPGKTPAHWKPASLNCAKRASWGRRGSRRWLALRRRLCMPY
jgi:transposase-like protein